MAIQSYDIWLFFMVPVAVGLLVFGVHRMLLLVRLWQYRDREETGAEPDADQVWPKVTIQLPVYNERFVIKRLIEKVTAIEYPQDRLEIQVLDDSTDETYDQIADEVKQLQSEGFPIQHIHRTDRRGYKAGALEAGLQTATGDFIAVFDADFVPCPQFLKRLIPAFKDEKVGIVQARWTYLNRAQNILTRLQAILLDGHFFIEQASRYRSQLFCNFNGTAGIWRKSCIEDAGGWNANTLTEDLDLSYRAQRKGWKFVYRGDVEVASELPADMASFKSQQYRWAKGAIETSLLQLPALLVGRHPLRVKLEAFMHLLSNAAYILVAVLALVLLPHMPASPAYELWHAILTWLLALASVFHFLYFAMVLRLSGQPLIRILLYIPGLIIMGVSLAVNNSRAVFEALIKRRTEFIRTPKTGERELATSSAYSARHGWIVLVELGCMIYYAALLMKAILVNEWESVPIFSLFMVGFAFASMHALSDRLRQCRRWIMQS
ncbi:MAG: glycosyltransferase [Verrucomicrobiota bacterium]